MFNAVDEESIRRHVENKRELLKRFMRMDDRSRIHEAYREVLEELGKKMRET